MSGIQVYSLVNVAKVAATVSVLLYLGITKQQRVDDYYHYEDANRPANPSVAKCQSCLDHARLYQQTLFEFGYCRTTYPDLAVLLPNNLLKERAFFDFSAHRSNARWYMVDVILIAIAASLLSIVLPVVAFSAFGLQFTDGGLSRFTRRHHRTRPSEHARSHDDLDHDEREDLLAADGGETDVRDVCIAWNYMIGVLTAGLLMSGGLEMCELYVWSYVECYISPFQDAHLWASTYLFRLVVFILAVELFFLCCYPNKWVLLAFHAAAGLAALGLFVLGVVMTVRKLTATGAPHDWTDWLSCAVVWVGAPHLVETPLVLFFCVPRRKPVHAAYL